MQAIIGRKIGMTQIISDDGTALPVTILQAGPCTVMQIRDTETDGYQAVQLGFETAKKPLKAQIGHAKKHAKTEAQRLHREFRTDSVESLSPGEVIDVSVFSVGDKVSASGVSKGKGFAGTVKRHNFNTSKKTHGGKGASREPGSIGSMYPQKVMKGKKMAGRMGGDKVTVKNLEVVFVDKDQNLIGLKGAIPGAYKTVITLEGDK